MKPDPIEAIYSPIALDLGAQNTGVFMAHALPEGGFATAGAVVCLANDKITWMQKERTAKRHQRRSIKRKHLVRRLLWNILEWHYGLKYDDMPKSTVEFVNGLLRRRGFTYLTLDDVPEPEDFANLELAPYLDLLPALQSKCGTYGTLADLLKGMGEDISLAREVLNCGSIGVKEVKKHFTEEARKEAILGAPEDYTEGFKVLRQTADATVKALDGGHKPRWDYLRNIEADILSATDILAPVLSKFGNDGRAFARLVGNLSNLQLRVLRKYFNDPVEKKGEKFDDGKLKGCLLRWMLSWHVEGKDCASRKTNCDSLSKSASALDWLVATPPERTIPPFEDQDNRRHPTDMTLLMDDGKLSLRFPLWRELADALMEAEEKECGGMLLDSLDDICALQDRKADTAYLTALMRRDEVARKSMNPFPSHEDKKRMYFLCRLLDRSKALDPYLCRKLSGFGLDTMEADASALPEAYDAFYRLRSALNGSPALLKTFFRIAGEYYSDLSRAKGGLWFDSPETIFRVSGLNTPRKDKIRHILLGHILGETFTPDGWRIVEHALDGAKIGRAGFWNALEFIETVRKESGNSFADEFALAQRRMARQIPKAKGGKKEKLPAGVDPDMAKAIAIVEEASRIIAAQLGHAEKQSARYSNPFSLAQLYIHAKGDIAGFSNSCEAIARENQWRSTTMELGDGELSARCSRMTSDSTRPFDGALLRMLERQARRIADLKLAQIGENVPPAINVAMFLEENAFTFTEGLAKVKTGNNPQGRLKKRLERLERRQEGWKDKDGRIKAASCDICPYTGKNLGGSGEIDHIIPRSLTKSISGTVFNHEANLIYCSNAGNNQKGNKTYGIENLSGRYLLARFGTQDVAKIKDEIRATISNLASRRDIFFQSLTDAEQRDVRHALFMYSDREVFHAALDVIKTQIKTRVNGTQAFLAKKTCEFLSQGIRERRPDAIVKFRTEKVPAETVSDLRRWLADVSPDVWRKVKPQPVSSHVRDAFLALVCGEDCNDPGSVSFCEGVSFDKGYSASLEKSFPKTIDVLQQIRRDSCDLPRVSGRAIFKDTLYQEHFVPVWSFGGEVCLGFMREHLVKVKPRVADEFYAAIRPFLLPGRNGYPPAESPEAFVASQPVCWPIDKAKAIAWLFEYEKNGSCADVNTYRYLDSLRYTSVKKDVMSVLLGFAGKAAKYDNVDKLIKGSDIKIAFAEGTLRFPAAEAWERLVQALRQSGIEDGCDDTDRIRRALDSFFAPVHGKSRRHTRVRKVFSLPVMASPSGGVRIRRRDWRGNSVIQLATSDFPSIGFAVSAVGAVDFAQNVRHPDLGKSGGIAFVADGVAAEGPTVKVNEWRMVDKIPERLQGSVLNLELSPNSRDRMRVRCCVKWDNFRAAYGKAGLPEPATAFDLVGELPSELAEQCGLWAARSKLFVENIGKDRVSFSYIVNSTSGEMRELYNSSRAD